MTFKSSGDCSQLYVPPDDSNDGLKYRNHNTIELGFRWVRSYNSLRYLFVPEECFLYLTDLKLYEVQNMPVSIKELKYSHLNNRPPELIGLASSVVENLNLGITYIDSLTLIPPLPLTSYTTTTAEFTFTPADTDHYVIPQDSQLVLWSSSDKPRNSETVKIRFRRMDDENCSIPQVVERRGVKLRELENELEFEVEYEEHVLISDGIRKFRMPVFPDCELRLLHFSRTLRFSLDLRWKKVVQYSMTPLLAEQTYIYMSNPTKIQFPPAIRCASYLECLSDFPPLHVLAEGGGILDWFRSRSEETEAQRHRIGSYCIEYLLPAEVPIVLHTVVKNARLKSDVVEMTFKTKTKDCRLEFVDQEDNEAWSITWVNYGRTVNVMLKIHLLNANFLEGTQFILKSTCLLHLTSGSRRISQRILERNIKMKLGSENVIF